MRFRLSHELAKALQQPDVKDSLASFAADPVDDTPDVFAATVKHEVVKFQKIVNAAHIKTN